jgi:hypothetical protein
MPSTDIMNPKHNRQRGIWHLQSMHN